MGNYEYVVNDIDTEMRRIAEGARKYGWYICRVREGDDITAPSLFPTIPEDRILTMVKAALRRDCSDGCEFCSQEHPMLQVEEYGYYKLCTSMLSAYLNKMKKQKSVR